MSEFATRIPGIVMSTMLVPMTHRCGSLIINRTAGYYGAFLMATSGYLLDLVSGRVMVDHNDVAFIFYVSVSIWAWIEFHTTKKRWWIVIIGISAGFAVLCKYLTGLVVYAGWLCYLLIYLLKQGDNIRKLAKTTLIPFLLALLVTVLTLLPWYYISFTWFPTETFKALLYNHAHYSRMVEGHGGPVWFYFSSLSLNYGILMQIILLPAVIVFLLRVRDRALGIGFLFLPVTVYAFFSFSQTKMPGYTFMISMPVLLIAGSFIEYLFSKLNLYKDRYRFLSGLNFPTLLFIGWFHLSLPSLINTHSLSGSEEQFRRISIANKSVFRSLSSYLPPNTVVFNLKGRSYVECMFYSGFTAYNFIPSRLQYQELKDKNRPILVFVPCRDSLPPYLAMDYSIRINTTRLRSCD